MRCFITGVTPLLLTENVSGFNVATNISLNPMFPALCGLTKYDVTKALDLVCNDGGKMQ